ncbi:LysR family transcriptional regulator [Vibrio panuliri]|uniref:LysR family transcriptional regulator n=1 Tax=Vibrio panuliri TaxID=1381081 RepID=A0A1Q9HN02_9VIBR|nr:LysR family transcriptional regulator [Vibrio panuliri]OLQ92114.1 LysR family transcriptional regulator [Vibrio panuliri]
MKNTDLNLVPIFVAIFEEQNLSKAALRLDISQPAVSKALARLRDIYDEPLFHRSPNGVEPTAFASDIYPAMVAALKNFTSTLSASRDFDPSIANKTFSIACVTVASYQLIPQLFKQIRQIAPHISLEIHPLFTEDHESDLRLQRYDLIVDMAPRGRTMLRHETIFSERLMVVCSVDHPRIKNSITVEQFLAEQHVVVSRWQSRQSLLDEEDIADLNRREIVYRAPGALEMLPVIRDSELIGMLPESTIRAFSDSYQIKGVSLPFKDKVYDLCSIWHPSRSNESAHIWLRKQLKLAANIMVK